MTLSAIRPYHLTIPNAVVHIPAGARFLAVGTQAPLGTYPTRILLWARVDPDAPLTPYEFHIATDSADGVSGEYVGSVLPERDHPTSTYHIFVTRIGPVLLTEGSDEHRVPLCPEPTPPIAGPLRHIFSDALERRITTEPNAFHDIIALIDKHLPTVGGLHTGNNGALTGLPIGFGIRPPAGTCVLLTNRDAPLRLISLWRQPNGVVCARVIDSKDKSHNTPVAAISAIHYPDVPLRGRAKHTGMWSKS